MARILITWELGGGLGHVARLRAIGAELIRRGHKVALIANNVALCRQALADLGLEVRPAPKLPISPRQLKYPCTYSDILHDCGYGNVKGLSATVAGWLTLLDEFQPHLVLCDHSPTALMASRVRNLPTATVGTGFTCPPDVSPMPNLRSAIRHPHWVAEVEQAVLDNMNACLAEFGAKPLVRVAQIFGLPNRQYLLTFEILDHYAEWRKEVGEAVYWSPVGTLMGEQCEWPSSHSAPPLDKHVFVYLRDEPSVLSILYGLAYKKISTVCFAPDMSHADEQRFVGTTVKVCRAPVDLTSLCIKCDVGVLNGSHGTVSQFLRRGIPMLLIPKLLEQEVTASRLSRHDVGLHAHSEDIDAIGTSLQRLLEEPAYRDNALRFARLCSATDDSASVAHLVNDLQNQLLS